MFDESASFVEGPCFPLLSRSLEMILVDEKVINDD
ncbi:hypothetical protein A2U01_0059366 [Trifolium medium]|uniref:Uncharacterized protein n=1 Tax=Trifolium medium TaxID=97028 RepID=A0A392RNB8_9FABA|nr:hypothetical protein [Trifolium medium]